MFGPRWLFNGVSKHALNNSNVSELSCQHHTLGKTKRIRRGKSEGEKRFYRTVLVEQFMSCVCVFLVCL